MNPPHKLFGYAKTNVVTHIDTDGIVLNVIRLPKDLDGDSSNKF